MIRTILRMTVPPGREAEFERRFVQLDVLGAAARAAGMRSGELLRPHGDGGYVVTATWDGPEAYQAWRQSPSREKIGAELEALVAPSPDPEIYDVCHVHPLRRELVQIDPVHPDEG